MYWLRRAKKNVFFFFCTTFLQLIYCWLCVDKIFYSGSDSLCWLKKKYFWKSECIKNLSDVLRKSLDFMLHDVFKTVWNQVDEHRMEIYRLMSIITFRPFDCDESVVSVLSPICDCNPTVAHSSLHYEKSSTSTCQWSRGLGIFLFLANLHILMRMGNPR